LTKDKENILANTQRTFLTINDMEKTEIQNKLSDIKNTADLLRLLNDVLASMYPSNHRKITLKQLNYFANVRGEYTRYTQFNIPKKSGGVRTISAPSKTLKHILRGVNIILQSVFEPAGYVMGFTPGRSIITNAELHKNSDYVFNIDLKDFFPSINKSRVWVCLTLPPFNLNSKVADVIAGLCTMKEGEGSDIRYVLPQGAPTSPMLTNIVCRKLDRRLAGLAKKFNLKYSRYADDITFSGDKYVFGENGCFRKELARIIADQNFTINEEKTRLQRYWERQEVTGLVVSDKVNVPREYIRNLRDILYIWQKYGKADAEKKFAEHYSDNKAHTSKPDMEMVIRGKLMYLQMVRGFEDPIYSRLQQQFDTLTSTSVRRVKGPINTIDKLLSELVATNFDLNLLDQAL
jgi:retron-type reverse transcriptase